MLIQTLPKLEVICITCKWAYCTMYHSNQDGNDRCLGKGGILRADNPPTWNRCHNWHQTNHFHTYIKYEELDSFHHLQKETPWIDPNKAGINPVHRLGRNVCLWLKFINCFWGKDFVL